MYDIISNVKAIEVVNEEALNKRLNSVIREHERSVKALKVYTKPVKSFENKIAKIFYCYPEEYNVEITGKSGVTILLDCHDYVIYAKKVEDANFNVYHEGGIRGFAGAVEHVLKEYL